MKFKAGFTLVEVMVVVAIIGVLSAIIYPTFNDARDDARNKSVTTELKEMQLALEIYKSQNGTYPDIQAGSPSCTDNDVANAYDAAWTTNGTCQNYLMITDLAPEFIASLPDWRDSGNESCRIEYRVEDDNNWYKLTAENCFAGAEDETEGIQPDTEFSRCPSNCATSGAGECAGVDYDNDFITSEAFYESMAVYSAGGECQ